MHLANQKLPFILETHPGSTPRQAYLRSFGLAGGRCCGEVGGGPARPPPTRKTNAPESSGATYCDSLLAPPLLYPVGRPPPLLATSAATAVERAARATAPAFCFKHTGQDSRRHVATTATAPPGQIRTYRRRDTTARRTASASDTLHSIVSNTPATGIIFR